LQEPTTESDLLSFPTPGTVTVIDFWSTSCKPCLRAMPALQKLYETRKDRGLMIVGVAADDNPGVVIQSARRLGVHYPILVDASGQIRGALNIGQELPQTLIVGRDLRLRLVSNGASDTELKEIEQSVDALLAE
jgi:thiol-disulfide isomerase/thioredoxin